MIKATRIIPALIFVKNSSEPALVDREDVEKVINHRWYKNTNGYAMAANWMLMHRMVLGLTKDDPVKVDHINGDPLDNRKKNLRTCSHAENMANRKRHKNSKTGFKGVYNEGSKFKFVITKDRKQYWKCGFVTAKDAACAYDKAAIELHGEFARLNFPIFDEKKESA